MFKWLVLLHCPYLLDAEGDGSGGGDLAVLDDITDSDDDKSDDDDKEDKEDDDKTDDEEDTEDKEDEEDTEDEEDEDESDESEEDEEEDTEEEDRITHASDIKKTYPDFFKKFPDVKAALYRDQEFTELLGSPKEAENIVARSEILTSVEKDLFVDGNATKLLDVIKKDSKASFDKIAYKFLPYLAEADRETYLEVAALPIKQLLRNMVAKFDAKTNEHKAALFVHKYFFDNLDINGKLKAENEIVTTKSDKEKEYETKIQELDNRDMTAFSSSVDESYINRMTKVISEKLDDDERLSPWMRTRIIEASLAEIKAQLVQDTRFDRSMKALWAQAKTSKYSNDLKSRIVSTALARAKSLVPKVRAKLLAEALGKKVKKEKQEDTNLRKFERKETTVKQPDKKVVSKQPLSDMDILRGRG